MSEIKHRQMPLSGPAKAEKTEREESRSVIERKQTQVQCQNAGRKTLSKTSNNRPSINREPKERLFQKPIGAK